VAAKPDFEPGKEDARWLRLIRASFIATQGIYGAHLQSRDGATKEIRDYIESFHNRTRRYSHLGGVSPE
jgi:hypothetical protein